VIKGNPNLNPPGFTSSGLKPLVIGQGFRKENRIIINKNPEPERYTMFTVVASPKSISSNFPTQYKGDFDGKVTIKSVDYNKDNGCFFVHMSNPALAKINKEIIDVFGNQKDASKGTKFAEQTINRADGALKSAGAFTEPSTVNGETLDELNLNAKRMAFAKFSSLVGKEVNIHQFTRRGFSNPNINYIFNDGIKETPVATPDVAPGMIIPNFSQKASFDDLEAELNNMPF
jgi:hypothetical protein